MNNECLGGPPRRNNPLRNAPPDTRRFSNDNQIKTTFHFFPVRCISSMNISTRAINRFCRIIIALSSLKDEKISDDVENFFLFFSLVSMFDDMKRKCIYVVGRKIVRYVYFYVNSSLLLIKSNSFNCAIFFTRTDFLLEKLRINEHVTYFISVK